MNNRLKEDPGIRDDVGVFFENMKSFCRVRSPMSLSEAFSAVEPGRQIC